MNEDDYATKTINNLLLFKKNINSWSPKDNELKQDDQAYKDKLDKYATKIFDLLNKKDEKLIGTFDIESTLLNGNMIWSVFAKYNTANPGAIALIRFLKEQKGAKYQSSIASIASVEAFNANILLNQKEFFKNNHNQKTGDFTFSVIKTEGTKDSDIKTITDIIYEKVDIKKQPQIKQLLEEINSNIKLGNGLNKKYSVVFEALYRRFILGEENINMLFFDNDIGYIENQDKGITNFLDSKLDNSNDRKETVGSFLTELGITITPICAASGHITFEEKGKQEDCNQPRKEAVFLNDLARKVMEKQGLKTDEIDKKMLEAEKICFEEYVSRTQHDKLAGKDNAIKAHITYLDEEITKKQALIPAPPPQVQELTVKNNTIVVKKCKTSGNDLLCFMNAAFGTKQKNGEYKCSDADIQQKTTELKNSIIEYVNRSFTSDSEADKKILIEEYASLVTAEIAATSDANEKNLLQTSLDTLNGTTTTDNDKKQTIINCIDKIKNTFPLIWFSNAAKMTKNNIVLISEYNKDGNFHIDEHSVGGSKNDIYIHFDGTGVGHFSRCEQIDYKKGLQKDEINVSDIRLEQVIEEIYAKQRGIIDDMEEYNKEKIDTCINNIALGVDEHISDLKESCVIVDDSFVEKIIQKKALELNKLIDEKKALYQAKTVNNGLSSKIVSNTLYTPVYASNSNNGARNEAPEKIISPSANNSFKTDQPIDKNISADYSNPYIAKLKELQEKAQKIGIFSRITLAIFSWFSSSSAKKRSAIKKLKTISIKNEDKPSYKNDKEMYDLLKDCLDGAKNFVSNIPEEPLEKNQIYDHEKHNKASQTDAQDSSKHRSNLNQSRATTNCNNCIY